MRRLPLEPLERLVFADANLGIVRYKAEEDYVGFVGAAAFEIARAHQILGDEAEGVVEVDVFGGDARFLNRFTQRAGAFIFGTLAMAFGDIPAPGLFEQQE